MRSAALLLLVASLWACGGDDVTGTTSGSGGSGGVGGVATTGGAGGVGGGMGGAGGSAICADQAEVLDAALQQAHAAEMRPGGTAAAVITPDCGLWEGVAGDSGDAPLTTSQLLRIGSVTKTYVAAAILQLVAENALSLDDPLETFVTGVTNGDQITVRQLLNHTSGIYNYTDDVAFITAAINDPAQAITPQEIVNAAEANGPSFAPGAQWGYSNTNYVLLGMIIEQLDGGDLGASIRTRLLIPQALEDTYLDGEEALGGELAQGYGPTGQDATQVVHPSFPWAAGSMTATAADTVRWITALNTEGVVPEPQLTAMLEPVPINAGAGYGLGVFVIDAGALGGLSTSVGHGGDIFGYHTLAIYMPELDAAIATVVSSDEGDPNDILGALFTALYL